MHSLKTFYLANITCACTENTNLLSNFYLLKEIALKIQISLLTKFKVISTSHAVNFIAHLLLTPARDSCRDTMHMLFAAFLVSILYLEYIIQSFIIDVNMQILFQIGLNTNKSVQLSAHVYWIKAMLVALHSLEPICTATNDRKDVGNRD